MTLQNQTIGCERCRETGYSGRIGLFELMVVDDAIKQLIQQHANASQVRDVAVGNGMSLLSADGRRKVAEGLTTKVEVLRVSHDA